MTIPKSALSGLFTGARDFCQNNQRFAACDTNYDRVASTPAESASRSNVRTGDIRNGPYLRHRGTIATEVPITTHFMSQGRQVARREGDVTTSSLAASMVLLSGCLGPARPVRRLGSA